MSRDDWDCYDTSHKYDDVRGCDSAPTIKREVVKTLSKTKMKDLPKEKGIAPLLLKDDITAIIERYIKVYPVAQIAKMFDISVDELLEAQQGNLSDKTIKHLSEYISVAER